MTDMVAEPGIVRPDLDKGLGAAGKLGMGAAVLAALGAQFGRTG